MFQDDVQLSKYSTDDFLYGLEVFVLLIDYRNCFLRGYIRTGDYNDSLKNRASGK